MEIVIKGFTYNVGKMDVFKQFHVARRLAPLLYATSAALLGRLRAGTNVVQETDDLTALVQAAEPMVAVISSMADADSQYVISACLGVCQRQTGVGPGMGYQRVLAEGAQALQFQDIDLAAMMQLVHAAIKENLGNFLDALPEQPAPANPQK